MAPPLPAAEDADAASSLGFFERMGTKAPGEDAEAAAEVPGELQRAIEAQTISGKVREVVEGGRDGFSLEDLEDAATAEPAGPKPPLRKDEKLFNAAIELYNAMDFKAAVSAFVKVLNYQAVQPEVEKQTLIYLARIYYQLDMPLRTISLMEIYVDNFPQDPKREEIIFQIGKIHREVGQYDAAISAFYRVLNAIILAGEQKMQNYLDLARMAQFEIARTHFDLEEWAQALDLFERISLFELGPDDRETLRFYKARALLYLGRRGEGLREIEKFTEQYPESPFRAELQYEKARAQIEMNQVASGRGTLLDLIEMGGAPDANTSDEWVEWRRVAGNFLANYYYKLEQFETALKFYQSIVVMDESPQWQLPIVMQMANCFRRLEQVDRAIESLEFVAQEVQSMRERADGAELGPDLEFLANSANWQLDLLRWQQGFVAQLDEAPGS